MYFNLLKVLTMAKPFLSTVAYRCCDPLKETTQETQGLVSHILKLERRGRAPPE